MLNWLRRLFSGRRGEEAAEPLGPEPGGLPSPVGRVVKVNSADHARAEVAVLAMIHGGVTAKVKWHDDGTGELTVTSVGE